MIPCPHPDCTESMDDFEVTTLYGTTGPRMYVNCLAGHRFEVDVVPYVDGPIHPSDIDAYRAAQHDGTATAR